MKVDQLYYEAILSDFGPVAAVWWNAPQGPRVRRIFLCGRNPPAGIVGKEFADAEPSACAEIKRLGARIRRFLEGQPVKFDLRLVELELCGEFQRKILLAEYAIPRGRVSTYGRLARRAGVKNGARAAGRALAENPFPIVIPCHRAVRSDGGIGGYQGGGKMKRALLEMEGVVFSASGKVDLRLAVY